jgi:hypothetical protein
MSQLKRAIKAEDSVSTTLPSHIITDHNTFQPCAVLGERFIRRGRKMVPQVKIQWSGLPPSCTSWEHLCVVIEAWRKVQPHREESEARMG